MGSDIQNTSRGIIFNKTSMTAMIYVNWAYNVSIAGHPVTSVAQYGPTVETMIMDVWDLP